MDVKLFLVVYFTLFFKNDGAILIPSPADMDVCVGVDVTIPWSYSDDDGDINSVIWSVNGTDIMTYFGTGSTRDPQNSYNVIAANDKGSITITNAQRSNTGTYQIVVSALQTSSDQMELLVCESASSNLVGTEVNSVIQCTASDLGEPEAQLYVKVNGAAKSSSSATVKESDKVECCISGCAAKCIGSGNEYCKTVQSTIPPSTSTTTPPPPPVSSTTPPSTTKKSPDIVIIVPSVLGGVAAIVILISIIVCLGLRRKTNRKKNNKDVPDTHNTYMSSF